MMDEYRELPDAAPSKIGGLGGAAPESKQHGRSIKIGPLEVLGWKILPIPQLWDAGDIWRDLKAGEGNPGGHRLRASPRAAHHSAGRGDQGLQSYRPDLRHPRGLSNGRDLLIT